MGKAKGSALVDLVKHLRRDKEAARKLLPERLHHYITERILIASWYPEEDLRGLIQAGMLMFPPSVEDPLAVMGRFVAGRHLSGVYSHLRGEHGVLGMSHRAVALWGSLHDTGRLTVTPDGPRQARIELIDFGDPSPEICGIVRGYIAGVFVESGLRDPVVREVSCCLEGADRCTWACTWSDATDAA